jgi:hypothetical protein
MRKEKEGIWKCDSHGEKGGERLKRAGRTKKEDTEEGVR